MMYKSHLLKTWCSLMILILLFLVEDLVSANSQSLEDHPNTIPLYYDTDSSLPYNEIRLPSSFTDDLTTPQLIKEDLMKGEIDHDTANLYLAYAIADHEKLPSEYVSNSLWYGTLPLLSLRKEVEYMSNSNLQSEINAILSGICYTSTNPLPLIYNTTHFHIQFLNIEAGLDFIDYGNALEFAWETEINDFGWAAPPVLPTNPPPGNRYHVRIDELTNGLLGYVSNIGEHAGLVGDNPNTAWPDIDSQASCMVLNNDMSGPYWPTQQTLEGVVAHELTHSIQYGYGALTGANQPDIILIEGTADWMSEEVFDTSNLIYINPWPIFSQCMGEYTSSPYDYWITFRGMTEPFGTGIAGGGEQVMQDFWENTSQSFSSNMFSALNSALENRGTNLADAYHAYAIAVKFNRSCGGGYVYPYCLEEGPGYIAAKGETPLNGIISSIGNNHNGSIADNYALNWIRLPTGVGFYKIEIENLSMGGGILRPSIVCDTGTELRINPLLLTYPNMTTMIKNYNSNGCLQVVAVITNQSQTSDNPTSCTNRDYQLRTSPGTPSTIYLPIISHDN